MAALVSAWYLIWAPTHLSQGVQKADICGFYRLATVYLAAADFPINAQLRHHASMATLMPRVYNVFDIHPLGLVC